MIAAFAFALACKTTEAPQTFQPDGLYRHAFIQLEFPAQVDIFDRLYVTQYDPDGANVSGHYAAPRSFPSQGTIYVYPATFDLSAPSLEEFVAHFEQIKSNVDEASPGAELTESGGISMEINGYELGGAHARYTLRDHPVYEGPVDSHLYLFALDGWYLKFRFSHPSRIAEEIIPHEHAFISSTRWPTPDSVALGSERASE